MMRKFLIDEDVNQKAVRAIPAQQKGFDILYPEAGGFKGNPDPLVRKRTAQEDRVLVTCDRDFARLNAPRDLLRNGVLWIRPSPRISQRRVTELLRRFCEFLQRTFPLDPYDFSGKMFEIHEGGVQIATEEGEITSYVF
jgi:predicted nuclease of predicted toxin-antitoxin system